ncbi:hypothetical protein CH063_08357, partial [Colletotrichum higginsianum]
MRTAKHRLGHRFMLLRLSRIVIFYMSLACPFINDLSACQAMASGDAFVGASPHLWLPTFLLLDTPMGNYRDMR